MYSPFRFLNMNFKRPFPRQIAGDIRIGYVYNSSNIYCLLKKELVQHMLIIGRSGAGKTNILRILQIELYRLGIPFMSFDLAKYGTRYIKYKLEKLIILRWDKEFYFNPLNPPPGVQFIEWLMIFCDITSEVFGIRTASNLYLIEFLIGLHNKSEKEKQEVQLTMHYLSRELEQMRKNKIPQNEKGYINTILKKIKPICLTLGEAINVQKGIPIEELLKYPVCIELVGIKSSKIQNWIMSIMLAWIACYRESQKMPFGKLKHVFFYDEAAEVLGKGNA